LKLLLNGKPVELPADVDAAMPLLWVLRDVLNLTGTKFGCGIAACGACTVHVDGEAVRSCVTPVGSVDGKAVQTIEGLARGTQLHAVQQAWVAHQVPQCGYCQSGLLMGAAALLERHARPTDAQIDAAITHLCRCGSTVRVRAAIHAAAASLQGDGRKRSPQAAPGDGDGAPAGSPASTPHA
jgi:isoquinoline 1-oxidoreductase alpha subunit